MAITAAIPGAMTGSTTSPTQTQTRIQDPSNDATLGLNKEMTTSKSIASQSAEYRITCVNCRQRKVKCSKTHPCVACDRSGLSCTFPDRARLPRGRKRGSKATNGEILKRLNKLEELLAQSNAIQEEGIGPETQTTEPVQKSPDAGSHKSSEGSQVGSSGTRVAEEKKLPVGQDGAGGLDRYLAGHFWDNLSNEVRRMEYMITIRSMQVVLNS